MKAILYILELCFWSLLFTIHAIIIAAIIIIYIVHTYIIITYIHSTYILFILYTYIITYYIHIILHLLLLIHIIIHISIRPYYCDIYEERRADSKRYKEKDIYIREYIYIYIRVSILWADYIETLCSYYYAMSIYEHIWLLWSKISIYYICYESSYYI